MKATQASSNISEDVTHSGRISSTLVTARLGGRFRQSRCPWMPIAASELLRCSARTPPKYATMTSSLTIAAAVPNAIAPQLAASHR